MDHKEFLAKAGRKGGKARAKNLTAERMAEIAANAREAKRIKREQSLAVSR